MKSVLVIVGPTGVGKTGASMLLAQKLGTEIISADSMQIYIGMDIGTAKPSMEERQTVVHHMLDFVDPSASFSAGAYISALTPVIEDLHRRNRLPIIVGGTGLYVRAITRGIFSGPSADWMIRNELLLLEEQSRGILHDYLTSIDSEAARRIEVNDVRRTVRALEVCLKSSERISVLQAEQTKPLPYDFIKIGLTRQRDELYRMLDKRVDRMVHDGLVQEVKKLISGSPDKTPLQAIGYKEIARFLRGEIALEEAISLVKRNTRRYAKRQYTWFRKEDALTWIDVSGKTGSEEISEEIASLLFGLRPEFAHG